MAEHASAEPVEHTEHVLYRCDWCAIYPELPPRRSAAGVRAEEWNVDKWAFVRALKVVTLGSECSTVLYDAETESNELFAAAPGGMDAVEPVADSSRYFVLRVAAGDRRAFLGIGFRQREQASDFLAALSEAKRWARQEKEAERLAEQLEALPAGETSSGKFKMKEGETVTVSAKFKPAISADAAKKKALRAQLLRPSPGESRTGIPLVAPPAGGFPAWVTRATPPAQPGLTPPPRAPQPASQTQPAPEAGWAKFGDAAAAAPATAADDDFGFDDDAFGDFEEAAAAPKAAGGADPEAGSKQDDSAPTN